MSKQPDTASALAGIIRAKRGDESPADAAPSGPSPAKTIAPAPPSPAPVSALIPIAVISANSSSKKGRTGKSSDAKYRQFSVWLLKDTRKKVGRALDDADAGQDFSELVQELLEKWLKTNT